MTKNTSIVLIGVIAAVMLVGTLVVTMETGQAFALFNNNQGGGSQGGNSATQTNTNNGGNAANGGVNGGDHVTGHDRACENAGAAEHNPHCNGGGSVTGSGVTGSGSNTATATNTNNGGNA